MKVFIYIFLVFISQTNVLAQIMTETDLCFEEKLNPSNTYLTTIKNLKTKTKFGKDSEGKTINVDYQEYDSIGRLIYAYQNNLLTNKKLFTSHFYYDNYNNLIKEETEQPNTPPIRNFEFIYESKFKASNKNKTIYFDKFLKKTEEIVKEEGGYFSQTKWKYDKKGNIIYRSILTKDILISEIDNTIQLVKTNSEVYWDSLGRMLLSKSERDGKISYIENIYDLNGRIKSITSKDVNKSPIHTKIINKENSTEIIDPESRYRKIYYYDEKNRIIKTELFNSIYDWNTHLYIEQPGSTITYFLYNKQNLIEKCFTENIAGGIKKTEVYECLYTFY